jgi:hypothetical protein
MSVLLMLTAMAAAWALWATSLHRKLRVIHALVNSNMTAHMQSELEATVRELTMMREVARLHQEAGRDPTEETRSAIDLTEARVAELRAVLGDRFAVQDVRPT